MLLEARVTLGKGMKKKDRWEGGYSDGDDGVEGVDAHKEADKDAEAGDAGKKGCCRWNDG